MTFSPQLIGLGNSTNDGTGDTPRVAGGKINANMNAIASALSAVAPTSVMPDGTVTSRAVSAILGDTLNVLNFYLPADTVGGVTDDAPAVGRALAAAYARSGAVIEVPSRQGGYTYRSQIPTIDPTQYASPANGTVFGSIVIRLNGNKIVQTHNGYCFDASTNCFGAINGGLFGSRRIIIEGGGAVLMGNDNAVAAIRFTDVIGGTIRDLTIRNYTGANFVQRGTWTANTAYNARDVITTGSGATLRWYTAKVNFTSGSTFDSTNMYIGRPGVGVLLTASTQDNPPSTWCEETLVENVDITACLSGVALRGTPQCSFLGTVLRHITVEGQINNTILFELHGGLWDGKVEKCGGFINQPGFTGGRAFYLNGSYAGGVFETCWVDGGQDSTGGNAAVLSNANQVVFGPDYVTYTPWFPTFLNCNNLRRPQGWRSKMFWLGPVPRADNSGISANAREVLEAQRNYYVGPWFQSGFTASIAPTGGGATTGTMTVTAISTGANLPQMRGHPDIGDSVQVSGIAAGTVIIGYGTASSSNPIGTYFVNISQTIASSSSFFTVAVPSDSNDGLTGASPFASIQPVISMIYSTLDMASNDVYINVTGGTYAPVTFKGLPLGIGSAQLILNGDNGNFPTIDGGSTSSAVILTNGARLLAQNLKVQSANGNGFSLDTRSDLSLGAIRFGACSGSYVYAIGGSTVIAGGNWTCSGDAQFGVAIAGLGTTFSHYAGSVIDCTNRHFSGNYMTVHQGAEYIELSGSGGNITGYTITGSTGSKGYIYDRGTLTCFGQSNMLTAYPGDSNVFVGGVSGTGAPGYAS